MARTPTDDEGGYRGSRGWFRQLMGVAMLMMVGVTTVNVAAQAADPSIEPNVVKEAPLQSAA